VVRTPDMAELPTMEKIDLYALAFGREKPKQGRLFYGCSGCKRKFTPNLCADGNAPTHNRGKTLCLGSGKPVTELERNSLPAIQAQYGDAGWDGAKLAAASILHRVGNKYRNRRSLS